MKDIFILTKILFKNSLGKNTSKNSSKSSRIGMTFLLLIAFIYIVAVLGFLSKGIIEALMKIRQEEVFLSLTLLMMCGLSLFRTLLTAVNILYFSKDVEFLLPMPIKPIKIVFAKFNLLLVFNYITEIIMFGVPYIIYWYLLKLDITFLLNSVLVFLVIPIIPMIIASLLIVIIMRFTNFLKNKDVVQYLSVLIAISLMIGIQLLSSSSNQITDFVLANKIVEINGYSEIITRYFFSIKLSTTVLTSNNAIEVMKELGLLFFYSIGIYIVSILLISKMYLKSAIKLSSSGIRTRKLRIKKISKKSLGRTYIGKEFKNLIRTPIYLFQCVIPSIIFPIIIAIPFYRQLESANIGGVNILEIKDFYIQTLTSGFGFGLLLIVINFFYMLNFTSTTAISREGENALFMKYIPIPLSRQYKYKSIPGIIINLVPLAYVFIVLRIIVPGLNLVFYLKTFWVALLCNILINYFSVFIDVLNPKLHWSSEYAVVKQNINMLYGFFLNLIVMGIIITAASYIDDLNILISVLSGIIIFVMTVFEIFLQKYQNKIFKKIS